MTASGREDVDARAAPRSRAARVAWVALAASAAIGFAALGQWQLERRVWKHDLIARVALRTQAPPSAPPGRADWPNLSAARDEYRHVRVTGHWLAATDTLVQAVTERGAGFWVLTLLRTPDGAAVLINRGFVANESRDAVPPPRADEPAVVTGLLRLPEPGGGFLRRNDPAAQRWYSRDVQAIAAARGLADVAPYFIDAEAAPPDETPRLPVPGLTVLRFTDNHLAYAITWFGLSAMALAAAGLLLREGRFKRRR